MSHRMMIENPNVSDREKRMITYIMVKYNLKVVSTFKVRGAYKVVTDNGTVCLKHIKHGFRKTINGNWLIENLMKKNFKNVAKFFKTKAGESYVKYNKYTFYVTEWIDGIECNLENQDEAVNCVTLLANFHNVVRILGTNTLKIDNNLKNWPKIFSKNIVELERFKNIIDKKRIKNQFDIIYLKYIDSFYERGINALNILNNSNYYELSHIANTNKTLCHDSFYYNNIIKRGNEYFIIDLDNIIIDLQVIDLGKFIRRLMFRNNYKWEFQKAKYMIEAYMHVNPLTYAELEVMLALIIFPHKFWRLGKKRYIKQKNWDEDKYTRKLEKTIKYNDLEQKFLQDYLNYISNMRNL